jgi:hypothetical protein
LIRKPPPTPFGLSCTGKKPLVKQGRDACESRVGFRAR